MKIKPYIDKLESSNEYKSFQQGNKGAFLVAGFFVIDFETGKNIHQIDYYVPSKKKVAAFTLDHKVILQFFDLLNKKVPEKLDIQTKIDLDSLTGILQDEMKNRGITGDVRKMIAVLQNIKGQKIWNVNCVLSGMDLLRAHVEDDSKTVLKMEKASMMDYIRKMPGLPPANPQAQPQAPQGANADENNAKKLEQLDKLQKAIEKEKAAMQKQEKKVAKKKSK